MSFEKRSFHHMRKSGTEKREYSKAKKLKIAEKILYV